MKQPPRFVQRVTRIPEVLALLAAYPDGLPLDELAVRFDTDATTLREDLTTLLDVESWGWSFDIFRRSAIELVGPDDRDDDRDDDRTDDRTDVDGATIVRVAAHDAAGPGGVADAGLGVEHLAAGDLAMIYTAGLALLDAEPENAELESALRGISATMYGDETVAPRLADWNRFLPELRRGQQERRRVRIVYSRAWRAGVSERIVDPLRLVQTHRGWEVDAGPVGDDGSLRTYLLTNIRDAEVLDETFEPPPRLDALLHNKRETAVVRMVLDHEARWAADMYAESVDVVSEDDETFEADLELLPPAGQRAGLIMLASGPSTRILDREALPAAVDLVQELLDHHRHPPGDT